MNSRGVTPIDDSTLQRLISAAKFHIGTARNSVNEAIAGPFTSLEVAMHAGAAVELLAKAVLARVDHRLLCDRQDVQHALLELVAEQAAITDCEPRKAPKNPRTLDASLGLELACRIAPSLRPFRQGAKDTLSARNAAVHMAEPSDDPGGLIDDAELFTAAALSALGQDAAEALGRSHLSQLLADYSGRLRQLEMSTQQKIAAAAERYDLLVADLSTAKKAQLSKILSSRDVSAGSDGWSMTCPACDYDDAWLSLEVDYDYDFDGAIPMEMVPLGLDCPRCRLSLDASEIDAVGIDTNDPRVGDDY